MCADDPTCSITEHFKLNDPRVVGRTHHLLHDILVIAICAVIAGADGWVAVEQFGHAKEAWFRSFLRLPHGIPSHDTFGRVFAALDPGELSKCFTSWIAALWQVFRGQVVAVDGKTLRHSFDTASGKGAIHMVSAWAAEARLVLGQVKTEEKSNEITAIPKLLELLHIAGCIVTIDAMGCQKKIAAQIVDQGADYVLGLKGNQSTMCNEVEELFVSMPLEDIAEGKARAEVGYDYHETVDGDHGRIETRRCWCTGEVDWFADREQWKGLASFGMVESRREVGDKVSIERRHFISSLDGTDAKQFLQATRSHWGVENGLHWTLDVQFREDDSRIRTGNAAENFALLRRIALNLLKQEKTAKIGVKNKRLKAGWDERYLLRVLTGR